MKKNVWLVLLVLLLLSGTVFARIINLVPVSSAQMKWILGQDCQHFDP